MCADTRVGAYLPCPWGICLVFWAFPVRLCWSKCAPIRAWARIFRAHGAVAWSFDCSQFGFVGANVRRYAREARIFRAYGAVAWSFGRSQFGFVGANVRRYARGARIFRAPGAVAWSFWRSQFGFVGANVRRYAGGGIFRAYGAFAWSFWRSQIAFALEPSERVRDDTTESNSPRESGFSFMSIDWNAIRLSLKNRSAALQSKFFWCQKLES